MLLKELSSIRETRTIALQNTVELYKYLEKCLQSTDYSPVPKMEQEHQYMFDFLSKYFVMQHIGDSGGIIYSPSNGAESIFQMLKPHISQDITLTDAEIVTRIEAFLKQGVSLDELEYDSLDDLFR